MNPAKFFAGFFKHPLLKELCFCSNGWLFWSTPPESSVLGLRVSGQWQYLHWVALCTSIHSLCWKFPVPVDPVPICILSVAVVWEKCRKWQKAGDIVLTRAGREGMGDELGAWPGRFRALNLGTTATLTLRRGMFYGKRSDSGLLSWE